MCCAASRCLSCCCPRPSTITRRCPTAAALRGAKSCGRRARKTDRKPSEIPFNTGEGLRAAYYVPDDAASYSSFKEHVHQIDMLFPEWLHVDAVEANLMAIDSDSHREYPVIDGNTVHDPDDLGTDQARDSGGARRHGSFSPPQQLQLAARRAGTRGVGELLKDAGKRAALRAADSPLPCGVSGVSRAVARL